MEEQRKPPTVYKVKDPIKDSKYDNIHPNLLYLQYRHILRYLYSCRRRPGPYKICQFAERLFQPSNI